MSSNAWTELLQDLIGLLATPHKGHQSLLYLISPVFSGVSDISQDQDQDQDQDPDRDQDQDQDQDQDFTIDFLHLG